MHRRQTALGTSSGTKPSADYDDSDSSDNHTDECRYELTTAPFPAEKLRTDNRNNRDEGSEYSDEW